MREKEDRRTSYSKRMIREAMFELMKVKPINKITVKEICEKADVNRSTFYAYYIDIYDLHEKILKEFFLKQREMIQHTKAFLQAKPDITDLSVNDFYEITLFYCQLIKDNKELYKFIFNQNSTTTPHMTFMNVFFRAIDESLTEPMHSIFRRSFLFVSGGTTLTLTDWLENECNEPTEKIAKSLAYYYNGVFNGQRFTKKR